MTPIPYGEWPSPVSAADVAHQAGRVGGGRFVDGEPWWDELVPEEEGRVGIFRLAADGTPVAVLPAPWSARTRVHEYGGGAWTVVGEAVVFAQYSDQRLYRLVPGQVPTPLTPEPPRVAGLRYGDLVATADGRHVLCVRETHTEDRGIVRDICAVPVDGSAVADPDAVRSVVNGSHFLAHPRVSPDGRRLAWIAWDHPQMPWDGTELRIADIGPDGRCGPHRTLLGSATESLLQPEWADADRLYVLSDRSGWWNPYEVLVDAPAQPRPLCALEEEIGGPLWSLGQRWYAPLPDGRLLVVRTFGTDRLGILDPVGGELVDVPAGDLETIWLADVEASRALLLSGGSTDAWGLRSLDLTTGELTEIRNTADRLPAPGYRSVAQPRIFIGPAGRDVHALVYAPTHPDASGPPGELPPYVIRVHGGPTSQVAPRLDPKILYFTSRGIGVVDVNYGGSTGYGRAYRERLRGQWGVVDVEDVVAVAQGLVESGEGDAARIGIEGGSAGGWTVLAALTTTDVFACGVSYYGVAELLDFAKSTHDFESRYLDGLIGPLPEAHELYESRAPVNNADGMSCPVLLLQGLDDPVVPPAQAEMFRDALVRKGIPHAYIAYEGESHGFRRQDTTISALESSLSFYGQVMGFEPPGVPRLQLVGSLSAHQA